jgi:hypothetical protein
MQLPKKGKERLAALIMIGLFGGVVVFTGLSIFMNSKKRPKIPIEQAMWVTDWDIERIYGPGSPEQQKIVNQFRKLGDPLEFNAPVLYRMGASSAGNPSEGILLIGFDPKRPETARVLAASQQAQQIETEQAAPSNR